MASAWPMVPLGEVLRSTSRPENVDPTKEYRLLGIRLEGKGPFLRETIRGSGSAAKMLFRVKKGDFIYSRLFASRGAFGVIKADLDGCYVSSEFPTFTPVSERIDVEFLRFWFQLPTTIANVEADCTGSTPLTRNRFKENFFLTLEIPLPPPEEQRRIVARIEELATKIEEAKRLRRQAVDEAEALLMSASAELFRPRKSWRTAAVGEFCEPPQYGYTESAIDEPIGPRFLRITDIQDGCVDWSRVPYCRCSEPEKYLLKPGDLVFARTGATTGKSFVIHDCPDAVFASYLIRLRVRDMVSVDYLYHYFQSPGYWEQIADEKKGTGQPNLNGSKLARLRVPVAPPEEQDRIVAYFKSLQGKVDALKRWQAETAAELDAMLPSILDKAFRGEL